MVGILAKSKEYSNAICIFNNLRGLSAVVAGSCYTHRQDGARVALQAFLVFYIFPGSLLTLLQIMLVPAEARTGRAG